MKIKYVVNVMNYINKSFSLSKNISVSGNLINYDRNTKFLFVLLHGWGADGKDLEGLVPEFLKFFPSFSFFVPNAPFKCSANPMGFQWFEIVSSDFHVNENRKSCIEAGNYIIDLLGSLSEELDIKFNAIFLSGFSQGGMVSLSAGIRSEKKIAGLISLSGALLDNFDDKSELNPPPCLIVHGSEDSIVLPEEAENAYSIINKFGNYCEKQIIQNLGHGINNVTINHITKFVEYVVNKK